MYHIGRLLFVSFSSVNFEPQVNFQSYFYIITMILIDETHFFVLRFYLATVEEENK